MTEPLELKRDHTQFHYMDQPDCIFCRMQFRSMIAAISLADRGLLNYSTENKESESETVNG